MDQLIYTPYTYLLKFIPTGQVYYGVRFASNCHPTDFFIDYFTSSKIIKFLIENFGKESFEYEIRRIFSSKEKAVKWEEKILRKFDVRNNLSFLNIDDKQKSLNAIQNKFKTKFIYHNETNKMIRVPIELPIPNGWSLGNIKAKNNKNTKNRIWCHDPITLKSKMVKNLDEVPLGWSLSRPKNHSNSKTLKNKKLKWATNGIENILIENNELPLGYRYGRTKSQKEYESIKESNRLRFKNSSYYNDGVKNYVIKFGEEPPKELKKGKLKNITSP